MKLHDARGLGICHAGHRGVLGKYNFLVCCIHSGDKCGIIKKRNYTGSENDAFTDATK